MGRLRHIAKQVTPPFIVGLVRREKPEAAAFSGEYQSWQQAVDRSTGYDANDLLDKVRQGAMKVRLGEAAFERDTVAFEVAEYRWPILASLLDVYARSGRPKLHVLDFGGSLGSVYFQHRLFLESIPDVQWSVVELPHFVRCGQNEFEDGHLKFYYSIQEALERSAVDVVLFSGVLHYLESPYEQLTEVASAHVPSVVIDRTPFTGREIDYVTVQNVPPSIYRASYPSWLFSERRVKEFMEKLGYELMAQFASDDHRATDVRYAGLYYRRGAPG